VCNKLIKNSQPFGKKFQKTVGGDFFDSHCILGTSIETSRLMGLVPVILPSLAALFLWTEQPSTRHAHSTRRRSCQADHVTPTVKMALSVVNTAVPQILYPNQ